MGLNLNVPKTEDNLCPRITVVGVGGAGGNAVNNMISSNLEGVEFLVCNTDAQALQGSMCDNRLQLGRNITAGLGAGARPEIGRAAAEEAMDEVISQLEGSHMVFIAAGMGGGTGTGAGPVIARAAREAGMLTVGVVTKPFQFEGIHRMRLAEAGINELSQHVDTLIIIPNQNLFRVANEKTTFADAFKMADDVLYSGVRGVTDLMVMPGLINLDFADIRAVMTEMGKAMMGTGEAEGENRAIAAAEAAIANPLLDEVSMKGARGVLINITGGGDLTLFEVDEAANRIRDEVDPEANIIFGSCLDESLEGRMRVSVVSTGIDGEVAREPRPVNLSVVEAKAPAAIKPAAQPSPAPVAEQPAPAQPLEAAPAPVPAPTPVEEPAAAELADEVIDEDDDDGVEVTMDDLLSDEEAESLDDVTLGVAASAEPQPAEREEAFIAPEPMKVERNPLASPVQAKADPFAAADMANAASRDGESAKPAKRNKAYSLFSKVTGVAKAMHSEASEPAKIKAEPRISPKAELKSEPAPEAVAKSEPVERPVAKPTMTEAPSRPPQRAAAPKATQQPLSGLERDEASQKAEEDLLDIPAFLRRQAN